MAKLSQAHAGSLQFYPRKRASKVLPSVNWTPVKGKEKSSSLLGFIVYKVGMVSSLIKDNTPDSMTKGKKIFIPATILEAPNMKLFSIRFYKYGNVIKDVIVSKDNELKRILRLPKEIKSLDSQVPEDYDDIRVIAYSMPKQTSVKKTPDIAEIAVQSENKLEFIKGMIGKEIYLKDSFLFDVVDIHGLTKGHGLTGPVKRFGITLKQHKTEKGVRRPGSLGPWHPAHVTFRVPMAGQYGFFSRTHYNLKIISSSSISEKDINPLSGFRHYGKINSSYIIISGSVQGPSKRQMLLTPSFRQTKHVSKKKYELQEIIA